MEMQPKPLRSIKLFKGARWRKLLPALAPLLGYLLLQAFPQLIFAHSLSNSGITIYSTQSLPPEALSVLKKAAALVSHSELAAWERKQRIFISDRPSLARIFDPTSGGFASHVAATGNIFIREGDLSANSARRDAAVYNHRALSSVIAHEITHNMIFARFGIIEGGEIPAWVAEGYCDYIAQEGSFPESEGMTLLKSGRNDGSSSFQYFLYRHAVAYLIDTRHMSFEQIVTKAEISTSLLQSTLRDIRARQNDGSI